MPVTNKTVKMAVSFTSAGRSVAVATKVNIELSGDRRRWARQIEAQLVEEAIMSAKAITERLLAESGAALVEKHAGRLAAVASG